MVGTNKERALAPEMSRPSRPSDPKEATGEPRQFFITSRTAEGRSIFQTERMAGLFVEVLRSYIRAGKFTVHDFVVMPDHVHILMTVPGGTSLEKAVQLIKGNFSFRAKGEARFPGRSLATRILGRAGYGFRKLPKASQVYRRESGEGGPCRRCRGLCLRFCVYEEAETGRG